MAAPAEAPGPVPATPPGAVPAAPPPAPRAVGAGLVALGLGAAATSLAIPLDQYGGWGARLFPLGAGATMASCGLAELRRTGPGIDLGGHGPAIAGMLAVSVAYVLLMAQMGYLIATGLAAPAILWIFGIRRPAPLLAFALACPVAYHLVFFEALGVFPPLGRRFDLLDVVGGY